MKAIILAAGRGSRMGELTNDQPKCLIPFLGKPLIEHQIDTLQQAGIKEIALVTGYKAEALKKYKVHFFHNQLWEETNIVGSLFCAFEWLKSDDCLVSYSDIFYEKAIVTALMKNEDEIAIAYDPDWLSLWKKRFDDPLSDAESFKLNEDGCLIEIGLKSSNIREIQGQYMGFLKFNKRVWGKMNLEEFLQKDITAWLQQLIKRDFIIRGVKNKKMWIEIDSSHDLYISQKIFKDFSNAID